MKNQQFFVFVFITLFFLNKSKNNFVLKGFWNLLTKQLKKLIFLKLNFWKLIYYNKRLWSPYNNLLFFEWNKNSKIFLKFGD